jgi:hypothetical protein
MNAGVMLERLQRPMIVWGIVAQVGIELTFLGSLAFVRNRAYGFFLMTHIVGYILFPIFVSTLPVTSKPRDNKLTTRSGMPPRE